MFAYTPYDGSRTPFSIGLKPLDPADWIEPDAYFSRDMAEKDRLFADAGESVLRLPTETLNAQREVLDLLIDYLPRRDPARYEHSRTEGQIGLLETGSRFTIGDWDDMPLALAARLVQDDLCIMRKGERGYMLAAAVLCFPSSWSLAEKFGQEMGAIHRNVPGFSGDMERRVDRVFDNLATDRPVWRLNWSIYGDPGLHHAAPKARHGQMTSDFADISRLFIRVERQTLRRLPITGEILFTIRIYHDPLAGLARHAQGAGLISGLRSQLLALDADQLAYKGLTDHRAALAGALAELASKRGPDSSNLTN